MYPRVGEKRRNEEVNLEDEEAIGSLSRLGGRPVSPKTAMEQEKRIRREIANSNERRRMQSINAGFASLKTLLPHNEGEKLSKAAILQQTAEYIYHLEQEKTRLLSQNCQLKRLLNQQHHSDTEGSPTGGESPDERSPPEATPPPPMAAVIATQLPVVASSGENMIEVGKDDLFERREKRQRVMKIDDRSSRGLLSQIKSDYRDLDRRNSVKIEIKDGTQSGYSDGLPKVLTKSSLPAAGQITLPIAVSPNSTLLNPPTTIVTVLPSNKVVANKSLPPLLELRDVSDIEVSDGPPTAIKAECIDDSSSLNHTRVFIVNSTNSSCQKSLDTICEAIRHLEGDHMFPPEDHSTSSRIEEELVTEETFTIEDDHHNIPHQANYNSHLGEASTTQTIISSHTLGNSVGQLTLHMLPPEPQDVPLELTTTSHRALSGSCHTTAVTPQYISSQDLSLKGSHQHRHQQGIVGNHSTILRHHSTRPGVIVVKHT